MCAWCSLFVAVNASYEVRAIFDSIDDGADDTVDEVSSMSNVASDSAVGSVCSV